MTMRSEPLTIPWIGRRTDGSDEVATPWYRVAPVTLGFVGVSVAIFLVIVLAPEQVSEAIVYWLQLAPGFFIVEPWRVLTFGFVHTDLVQLWPNCVFVLFMGAALETEIGSVAMLQVIVFSAIGGALTYAIFDDYDFYGASLVLGGIFAALVALPRHRGNRRLISPRTWWPLVVFVLAYWYFGRYDFPGFAAFTGCFAVGLAYGATHRPGRPPDVRRAIIRARQGVTWLAVRLGDRRVTT